MKYESKDLKEMSNVVQAHALRAILSANSGHVGIVLGAADVITTLFVNFLRRGLDRFVLSAGHGSALLYSVLKLSGYDIGNLAEFRSIGGLPGHPEFGIPGVDATTGPLGQGVGNAVGLALAQKIGKSAGRTYCLCSDGDLMEGVAAESIAFAGRYKLNNLVLIWDDNGISIDGPALTDIDVPARMRAAGWCVLSVAGDDFTKINRALSDAQKSKTPVFIQVKTQIGRGSSVAGKPRAHGLGISADEIGRLASQLLSPRGIDLWAGITDEPINVVDADSMVDIPAVSAPITKGEISTRELSGIYLNELIAAGVPLVGGSADLGGSTNSRVAHSRDITPPGFDGNYINYGVREHAMGAIMNGLAAAGLRPYGATFLVFSDYMRPSIRIAALSGLPVIYVFTHDSVAVGEDGPTHQPVEQLPSLRLIPNLNVFRPCNMAEVAYSWRAAIADIVRPSCIILSRQKIRQIETPAATDLSRGAYVIWPAATRRVRATIIATGSEVSFAVAVAKKMGNSVQVVSMPSVGAFRAQDCRYKRQILRGFVIAIEAAAAAPWFEFADAVVGVDEFGVSGPGGAVYKLMGFDVDAVARDLAKKIK